MTPLSMLPVAKPAFSWQTAQLLHASFAMSTCVCKSSAVRDSMLCMDIHIDLPPTRAEARARGLKHYFTGKPCKHGHVAKRHLTGTCVPCGVNSAMAWDSRNPGKVKERNARYYAADPARFKARSVKSKRKAMGIPAAERPKPNACELCSAVGRQMHLDHDHATGKFRGWLCNRCNMAMGVLGDTVASIQRAIDYLRRNGSS